MIEAKPENLIGDRAYDNDPLDAELRKDGIALALGTRLAASVGRSWCETNRRAASVC